MPHIYLQLACQLIRPQGANCRKRQSNPAHWHWLHVFHAVKLGLQATTDTHTCVLHDGPCGQTKFMPHHPTLTPMTIADAALLCSSWTDRSGWLLHWAPVPDQHVAHSQEEAPQPKVRSAAAQQGQLSAGALPDDVCMSLAPLQAYALIPSATELTCALSQRMHYAARAWSAHTTNNGLQKLAQHVPRLACFASCRTHNGHCCCPIHSLHCTVMYTPLVWLTRCILPNPLCVCVCAVVRMILMPG